MALFVSHVLRFDLGFDVQRKVQQIRLQPDHLSHPQSITIRSLTRTWWSVAIASSASRAATQGGIVTPRSKDNPTFCQPRRNPVASTSIHEPLPSAASGKCLSCAGGPFETSLQQATNDAGHSPGSPASPSNPSHFTCSRSLEAVARLCLASFQQS